MNQVPENVMGAIEHDPWLRPYAQVLSERRYLADKWLYEITHATPDGSYQSLSDFTRNSYKTYGLHAHPDTKEITYKEWAPNAKRAFLLGDFNGWNKDSHEMKERDEFGNFYITLPPNENGDYAIPHDSRVKVRFVLPTVPMLTVCQLGSLELLLHQRRPRLSSVLPMRLGSGTHLRVRSTSSSTQDQFSTRRLTL